MTSTQEIAAVLAADLAGARVDPNEAQKALAYLRSKKDAKLFFEYLRAINKDGRAVIRSGQTLGYYRDLLGACERHLRGMDAKEMALSLGWAIRLLRYYRAVPGAEQLQTKPQHEQPKPRSEPVESPRLTAPQIPNVGDSFAGKITAVDETVVLIEIPGFTENQAIGVLKAEAIEGGRTDRYRVGNSARVEVVGVRTLKSGRMIVELKPGAKKGQ